MGLHIGQIIRQHIEQLGMNKSEFARRINTTSQNLYGIFKRKSIDTALLKKISDVLQFDFFRYYTTDNILVADDQIPYTKGGKATRLKTAGELKKELEECRKECLALKKENEYLKEINRLLKEKSGK